MPEPATPTPPLTGALWRAARGPFGARLAEWEEALRAQVQQQLELAALRLSQGAPDLLSEAGPKFLAVDVTFPLPAGEAVRFRASLELVE